MLATLPVVESLFTRRRVVGVETCGKFKSGERETEFSFVNRANQ